MGSAACVAAALLLAACGGSGQAVTFSVSSTTPTIVSTSTTGTTGTATTSVPIDALLGPDGMDFESNPALSAPPVDQTGSSINGIQCQSLRQRAYQLNSHLQVYVDGRPKALPGGIGMVQPSLSQTQAGPVFTSSTCYYWLYTVTQDGVIQVGSPVPRNYTLGEFFKIWGQPLSRNAVATATGRVTAIVDGKRWRGDPRAIPLVEHEAIELAVGRPVPRFHTVDWSSSDL
jgi:hypothetical protein